jgi:hypothetical protein
VECPLKNFDAKDLTEYPSRCTRTEGEWANYYGGILVWTSPNKGLVQTEPARCSFTYVSAIKVGWLVKLFPAAHGAGTAAQPRR